MKVHFGNAQQIYDTAAVKVQKVANRFAKGDLTRLERDVVQLSIQETSVKTATAIVRTKDEMLGSIIDLKA